MPPLSIIFFLSSTIRTRNPRNLLSPLFYFHTPRNSSVPLFSLSKPFCDSSIPSPQIPQTLAAPPDQHSQSLIPNPYFRSRTPLEKQFQTWIQNLNRGFTPDDVVQALEAQYDPDLALALFRWTAQQRGYKHNHLTYLSIINILISGQRYHHVFPLSAEVLAGACEISVPLCNCLIRFFCGHRQSISRGFDVYNKMLKSQNCKPNLETYSLLFDSLLSRFTDLHVSYIYLDAVRSLSKQMKACGVIPDIFVLNLIIKAYSKCREVDGAVRVFREMGLYGCEPDWYSYSCIVKACCEKGMVIRGFDFFNEMKSKGLIPPHGVYLIMICSLALERMFDEAIKAAFEMLDDSMSPDRLTYQTLLEELCRAGKDEDAYKLLKEFRKRDPNMSDQTYKDLLYGLCP